MFGFNSNKSNWKKIAESTNDLHFKEAINDLMIPFNISVRKFIINLDCIENGDPYSREFSSGCTFHCTYWANMPFFHWPLGFERWFLAAFPDVAHWAQDRRAIKECENAMNHIPEKYRNYEGGRFTIPALEIFIQTYLKSEIHLTTLPRNFLEVSN